jgi:hypothetical protein
VAGFCRRAYGKGSHLRYLPPAFIRDFEATAAKLTNPATPSAIGLCLKNVVGNFVVGFGHKPSLSQPRYQFHLDPYLMPPDAK